MTLSHEWGPGEIVGGHRLLRQLGSGPTAEVWLASPAIAEDGERVAIKLIRAGVDPARAASEAEVLWRARGPHVVRLRDVVALASGTPFLILDAVPHELRAVLAAGLSPGAAVTLLVPIAEELERLHAIGVGHGSLRLGAIGLDQRGTPILMSFGAATAGHVSAVQRAADCAAFAALGLVILAAIAESERSEEWQRLVTWLAASRAGGPNWLSDLAERAYRLAEPQPVALGVAESLGEVVQAAAAGRGTAVASASGPSGGRGSVMESTAHGVVRVAHALRDRLRASGERRHRDAPVARERVITAPPKAVRARVWAPATLIAIGCLAAVVAPAVGSADAAEQPAASPAAASHAPAPATSLAVAPQQRGDDADRVAPHTPALTRVPPERLAGVVPRVPEPTPTGRVRDQLGGAIIVEVEGPQGPEHLVLIHGPDGWELRDQLATRTGE